MTGDASERFAADLRAAEDRLRACGLGGRRAFVALVRHLAARLDVPPQLWPEGPDAPAAAALDLLPLSPELDLFGLAYERFFPDLFKGRRGQYFTPRPLVELVADLAGVRAGQRVLDPTCGSGGFLIAALSRGADPDGVEVDPDLAALARLNLALHGANPRAVTTGDVFVSDPVPEYDVVLANPPFSVPVRDPATLARHGVQGTQIGSDVLFLRSALGWLRPGGRLATLVPASLLSAPALAGLRADLDAATVREAVVSLPEGVFAPFGGTLTRAAILVLRKRPAPVVPTLCAVVRSPGYELNRRRFRRREPDELVGLRLYLRGGEFPRAVRMDGAPWVPEQAFEALHASGVPRIRVGDHVQVRTDRSWAEGPSTVLSLADVDPGLGEFMSARTGSGEGFVPVQEGELLYGRMRPELKKLALAERPDDTSPAALLASPEFLRLDAADTPDFLLLALRSDFARNGLPGTGGQTRPRARTEDVLDLELPAPPPPLRQKLDAALREARVARRAARQRSFALERLYARWGAGEIDDAALAAGIDALG